jgi:hypothetical protein
MHRQRRQRSQTGQLSGAIDPGADRLACSTPQHSYGLETYGASLAHHQALCARDPQVRAVMTAIAEDETRHAALSWQVAHWLELRPAVTPSHPRTG